MDIIIDSQNITPPSSPILGYSKCRGEKSIIESGIIFSLNCKGIPREHDYSFSSEGYILRREVLCALENFNTSNLPFNDSIHDNHQLTRCFGYLFNIFDIDQFKQMIALCQKNISSLEILSEKNVLVQVQPLRTPDKNGEHRTTDPHLLAAAADDPDELCNQNPWHFRKNVCHFLNLIVRQLKLYRHHWTGDTLAVVFKGLKNSLNSIKDWSSNLKSHCGFRNGNECTSASYHFFHLQMELRWSFFLILGASPTVVSWILEDLIQLAHHKYIEMDGPLDQKQPFNCVCVKEIWTMVKLVVNELNNFSEVENTNQFWDLYATTMQRVTLTLKSDVFFPIWLTAHLAEISEYTIAGVFSQNQGKGDAKLGKSGYKYAHGALKEWINRGGKSPEVLKLTQKFLQHWGGDYETVGFLWQQWVPRLDKHGTEVANLDPYSSVEKWLDLVYNVCESSSDLCTIPKPGEKCSSHKLSSQTFISKDPFLDFARLVCAHVMCCKESDFRRFKSHICSKLSRANPGNYSELGITRVSILFTALVSATNVPKEAFSLCERLQDMLDLRKGRQTPGRQKTILRTYSALIILLLKKNCPIRDTLVLSSYIKTVNELMLHSTSDSSKKDLAAIYIEMLDCLPRRSPAFSECSLGRDVLISPNLLMWLSNCGPNYVVRTVRILGNITSWIVTFISNRSEFDPVSSEAKDLFIKVCENCLPFLKSFVVDKDNRVPSTDVEPLGVLAANITILTRHFNVGKGQDEIVSQFDLFAMSERTCPVVSQFYVGRLFCNGEFVDNSFAEVKWAQAFIRLVTLDCAVPDNLTKRIIGTNFCSTSNIELLHELCKRIQGNIWDKSDVQRILSPMIVLVKIATSGGLFKADGSPPEETDRVISSIFNSCCNVLRNVKFDWVYTKGDVNSCGHKFLESVVQSSWPGTNAWDKLSGSVVKAMEANLYKVFLALVSYPGMEQDGYLYRKFQHLVVLAFLGFVRDPKSVDKDEHPLFKIINYCEDNDVAVVQDKILPDVISGDAVVQDVQLSQRFLQAVTMIRVKGFPSIMTRMLGGILRIFLTHSKEKINEISCLNGIVYCCQFGNSPLFRDKTIHAFRTVLEKEFAFKSKKVFQFCFSVAGYNKDHGKRFLKAELIPLLTQCVENCELKRASGTDTSLRGSLEKLKAEVRDIQM